MGGGLAGLSTAVELLDQGYEVDIYDQRPWIGGKVASFKDKDGNHIEMGLHVFFGCYFNVFRLMAKCGVLQNLLLKDHTHTFINRGGDVRELDFRFFVNGNKIGAPFHGGLLVRLVPMCSGNFWAKFWFGGRAASLLHHSPAFGTGQGCKCTGTRHLPYREGTLRPRGGHARYPCSGPRFLH